jgi:hypothetical protein
MRNRTLATAVALTTVAITALVSATPASAAIVGTRTITNPIRVINPFATKSHLVLTVAHGEKALPATRQATLTCGPAGGSHHNARKACEAIGAAGGNLNKLVPDQTMCTMQYDPVTVTANGRWRGATMRYTHTFSNACVLGADTGAVFAF